MIISSHRELEAQPPPEHKSAKKNTHKGYEEVVGGKNHPERNARSKSPTTWLKMTGKKP